MLQLQLDLALAIRLLIVSLASYRVSRMLALETGPFGWFSLLRGWAMVKAKGRKWIIEGVSCPLCIGFWASAVLLGLSYLDYAVYLVVWLAVAGLQVVLQKQERE